MIYTKDEPRQPCKQVLKEKVGINLVKYARILPKMVCQNVPKEKYLDEPRQECYDVPREEWHEVHRRYTGYFSVQECNYFSAQECNPVPCDIPEQISKLISRQKSRKVCHQVPIKLQKKPRMEPANEDGELLGIKKFGENTDR